MEMPNRKANSGDYRFGFNGMEKDDETYAEAGAALDFGARIYSSRLGKWLSVDPLMNKYPSLTPYHYVANSPLAYVDIDGRDFKLVINTNNNGKVPETIHDLGVTSLSQSDGGPIGLSFNKKTNEFDIEFRVQITYTQSFVSGTENIEEQNIGLFREVESHEMGHVEQFEEAARKNVTAKVDIGGVELSYEGRADEVINKVHEDWRCNVENEIAGLAESGKITSQEEINQHWENSYKEFNNKTLPNVFNQVAAGMAKNISTDMDPNRTDIDHEKDANNRSEERLGQNNMPYTKGQKSIIHNGKALPSNN